MRRADEPRDGACADSGSRGWKPRHRLGDGPWRQHRPQRSEPIAGQPVHGDGNVCQNASCHAQHRRSRTSGVSRSVHHHVCKGQHDDRGHFPRPSRRLGLSALGVQEATCRYCFTSALPIRRRLSPRLAQVGVYNPIDCEAASGRVPPADSAVEGNRSATATQIPISRVGLRAWQCFIAAIIRRNQASGNDIERVQRLGAIEVRIGNRASEVAVAGGTLFERAHG